MGDKLTKIVKFGTTNFVRYSGHVRYLGCPLGGKFLFFFFFFFFFFYFIFFFFFFFFIFHFILFYLFIYLFIYLFWEGAYFFHVIKPLA